MVYIIDRNRPHLLGKHRSEIEKNLRKEGWGKTLTDEQLDKCKYMEKKMKREQNVHKSFFDQRQLGV